MLIYWLCDALKLYKTVQKTKFLKFINHLSKKFKVLSEKSIRTKLIPNINKRVLYAVQSLLNATLYAITTDIWASPSNDSFMLFTVHWITGDFKKKISVLRCIPFKPSHTGWNISEALKNICKGWGLNNIHIVIRDNASNMILAIKLSGFASIGCLCHILHLVVRNPIYQQSGVKIMLTR